MQSTGKARNLLEVIATAVCISLPFWVGLSINARAQQPGTTSQPSATPDKPKPSGTEETNGSHVLGFMPNHLTVEDPTSHPPVLTVNQKFKSMAENTFDPFEFLIVGAVAGIGQARNDPRSWAQGGKAYGKRYAAAFADQADWNFWVEAALPSLLKEDPRYYRMGQGGALKRTGYAISRIFVIRTDSGHSTFNFPEIAGAGISAAMANAYYPSENRTLSKNLSRWGFLIGEDTVLNILKEFWPDIRHHISSN
ncbi:MAG TPA: hypothetical protein VG028_09585 [Terriglobia bacterium]|nr:hypothetical protein [Terriglobia bacterium]